MFRHELRKALTNKSFQLMTLFFIILSFAVMQIDLKFSELPYISSHELFLTVVEETNDLNKDKAYEYYEKSKEEFKDYLNIIELEKQGALPTNYEEEVVNSYMAIRVDKGEKYFQERFSILNTLTSEYYSINYQDYIDNVIHQLNNENNSPIIENMKNHYNKLIDTEVERTTSYFLDAVYSQKYMNIVLLIFMMYVVNFMFFIDDDEEMTEIINLTKVGKNRILFIKILAGLLIVVILSTITILFNTIYLAITFKVPSMLLSIQSFNQYFTSPYKLNIIQFLLSTYLYLIIYLVLNYILLVFFIRILKSRLLALIIYLSFYVLSYFLYIFILDNSIMLTFKFFNLFSFGQIFEILSTYRYFNLGPISATVPTLYIIIMSVLIIIFIILINITTRFETKDIAVKSLFPVNVYKIRTLSLRKHEIIKTFFMEHTAKMLIASIVSVIALLVLIQNIPISEIQKSRIDYINKHGGLITEDMDSFINEEKKYWDEYYNEYYNNSIKYNKGQISDEKFNSITKEYHEQSYDYRTFQQVDKIHSDSKEYFIEKTGYNILFSQYSYKYDNIFSFIVIISIILIFSNIYIIDRKNKENEVYKLTKKSTKLTSKHKWEITMVFTILLITLLSSLVFIIIYSKYSLSYFNAPMKSVINDKINSAGFNKYKFLQEIKIYKYILLVLITRLQGGLFVGLVTIIISRYSRNRIISILMLFSIFIFPAILYLSGFTVFSYLNVFDLISGNLFYRIGDGLIKVVFVAMSNLLLSLFLYNLECKS